MHKEKTKKVYCMRYYCRYHNKVNSTTFCQIIISQENDCARGLVQYPPKYRVSGSELLKQDFIQLKDTLGNIPVQASQALPQHKTGVWNASLHRCPFISMYGIENKFQWLRWHFVGGTGDCLKKMKSTDPSGELRCCLMMFYIVFTDPSFSAS